MSVLNLEFINNSGVDSGSVWVGFVAGASTAAFAIQNPNGGSALQQVNLAGGPTPSYPFAGNWYSLAALPQGVAITSFSGRVYLAYGDPWSVLSENYEPAQSVTDANFFLRYDKLEMTFTGQASDVADLTSIDYWSIPLSLTTSYNQQPVAAVSGLLGEATAQTVFDALNQLTTPPVSGVTGPGGIDGTALPALVPGQFQQYPKGPVPGTAFARVIGPSSYPPINPPPSALPVTPYDTWQGYLQYLLEWFGPGTGVGSMVPTLGNGAIARIAGNFAGVGPNPPASGPTSVQVYDLVASIDASLGITLQGTLGGTKSTMLYQCGDLTNPSGIYGGNTPYYLNGSTTSTNPGNDVYGWVGGDLFAGLNIGALGSTTTVGNVPGVPVPAMVGSLASHLWFGIPNQFFFGGLQPGSYYNRWAATLAPLSQAYNFAYSDRFAAVFVSLNPATVDTLTVVLEPATVILPA